MMTIIRMRRRFSGVAIVAAVALHLSATAVATAQLQFFVLRDDNTLFRHNSSLPSAVIDTIPIAGMKEVNELIEGIDFRPADGMLYGVSTKNRMYRIDPVSGVAAQVGTGNFAIAFSEKHGIDFNPTSDQMRVLDGPTRNIRFNPDTATQIVDTPLAYGAGDPNAGQPVNINAIAYTNNAPGAATTTLLGIDHALDVLVRIGGVDGNPSANGGQVTTIGPLGVDSDANSHFDIGPNNTALAIIHVAGSPTLFSINQTTGAAGLLGTTAIASTQVGLAIAPVGQFEFNTASDMIVEGGGVATVTVLRKAGAFGEVTVNYTTVDGTAGAPGDYTAKSGTLTFDVDETSKSVTIPIINDTDDEADETFTVALSTPGGGATLGTLVTTTITIVDNDEPPSIFPGVNCGAGTCGVGMVSAIPLALLALGYRRRRR